MKLSSAFSRPHRPKGRLPLGLYLFIGIALCTLLAVPVIAESQEAGESATDQTKSLLDSFDFSKVPKIQEPHPAGSIEALRSQLMSSAEGRALLQKADELTHEYRMRQEQNKLYEALFITAFAIVGLLLVLVFMCRRPACSATHMVTASGLVFVIFGTILLVILADAEEQLTAAIGVLGAIAGYLFGRTQAQEAPSSSGNQEHPRP